MALPEYTPQQAAEALRRHPYFILPAIVALKNAESIDSPDIRDLAMRVAVSMPDADSLELLLGPRAALFANFYGEEQPETPSTLDTIDTFLNTFGKPQPGETEALEKMLFNPNPDYAATLAAEGEALPESDAPEEELSEQDRRINAFIQGNPAPKSDKQTNPTPPAPAPEPAPEPSSLTESFARVMIKNRNYSKALEILTQLNLNNPEKSIYFADQIRFLRKLIINEKRK